MEKRVHDHTNAVLTLSATYLQALFLRFMHKLYKKKWQTLSQHSQFFWMLLKSLSSYCTVTVVNRQNKQASKLAWAHSPCFSQAMADLAYAQLAEAACCLAKLQPQTF